MPPGERRVPSDHRRDLGLQRQPFAPGREVGEHRHVLTLQLKHATDSGQQPVPLSRPRELQVSREQGV